MRVNNLALGFVDELDEAAHADAEVFESSEVDAFPELGGLDGAEEFELLFDGGDGVLFLKAGGDLDDFLAGGLEGSGVFLDQSDLHPQGVEVEEAGLDFIGLDLTG